MEHPFRDSVVTSLVKLVDVLPKLNVTADPELERLAAQVRGSLLVDPQELWKSEPIRSKTAKAASAIATRMKGYMAGYSVPAPPITTSTTTAANDEGRAVTPHPYYHHHQQQTITIQKLTRARTQLILNQPFFGTLGLG